MTGFTGNSTPAMYFNSSPTWRCFQSNCSA